MKASTKIIVTLAKAGVQASKQFARWIPALKTAPAFPVFPPSMEVAFAGMTIKF
jgi:hypothetical protein